MMSIMYSFILGLGRNYPSIQCKGFFYGLMKTFNVDLINEVLLKVSIILHKLVYQKKGKRTLLSDCFVSVRAKRFFIFLNPLVC